MNSMERHVTQNSGLAEKNCVTDKNELADLKLSAEVEECLELYRSLIRESLMMHYNNEADETVNDEITSLQNIMANRFSMDRDLLEKVEKLERQSIISEMVSEM